jgi:hypothetical protein
MENFFFLLTANNKKNRLLPRLFTILQLDCCNINFLRQISRVKMYTIYTKETIYYPSPCAELRMHSASRKKIKSFIFRSGRGESRRNPGSSRAGKFRFARKKMAQLYFLNSPQAFCEYFSALDSVFEKLDISFCLCCGSGSGRIRIIFPDPD